MKIRDDITPDWTKWRSSWLPVRCFKNKTYNTESVYITYNLDWWYWSDTSGADFTSKVVEYPPLADGSYLFFSTNRRTPSKSDVCEESWKTMKCMFDGWYLSTGDNAVR